MTETLAHAMCRKSLAKGYAEVRRYIDAQAVTVNDKLAVSWSQEVHHGDVIKLGKHRATVV